MGHQHTSGHLAAPGGAANHQRSRGPAVGGLQPLPTYGICVAITVIVWTFASSGSDAM